MKCIDCRYFVPNGETEGYCSEFVYPVNTNCYCNIDPASVAKEQDDPSVATLKGLSRRISFAKTEKGKTMYESPIKVDRSYSLVEEAEQEMRKLINAEETHIMYKVNLVVDVDKDELLKALRYDRGQYEKGYSDRDSEIVRCKDCKWYVKREDTCKLFSNNYELPVYMDDDDFCSRGERRDDGEIH